MAGNIVPAGEIPISYRAVELAHVLAGLAIAFVLISSALFGARLYTRTQPVVNLGIDDWFICAAYVIATADASVAVSAVRTSLGKHPQFIPATELAHVGRMALAGAFLQPWSMAAIKVSVAYQFLRFKQDRRWKTFLYVMIVVQGVTASFSTIMQATRFIPASAQWSPDLALRAKAQVWSDHDFRIGITIVSSSNIITDVAFSLLPVIFLWEIQRPLREKIIVGCLMALGLVASCASVLKIVEIRTYGGTSDLFTEGERIAVCTVMEEQLALIAACVPCLRAWFQRLLTRFGVVTTQNPHSGSSGKFINTIGRAGRQRSSLRRGPDQDPFSDLDDQSIELTDDRVEKLCRSPSSPPLEKSSGSLSV